MNREVLRGLIALSLVIVVFTTKAQEVHVLGEMRRMFTAHDIGANVDLAQLTATPHVYALGPMAGLKGEITALDGQVFTSQVIGKRPIVSISPETKAVFLVYASVSAWRTIDVPANAGTEKDLAEFVQKQLPKDMRSVFLVRALALSGRYHIQNYEGKAEDLTHELHDRAKVFFNFTNTPVVLVGFFTNREGDGGSFVHLGQTTHVHVLLGDRTQMGHLESITLGPGAKVLLPAK